MDPAKPLTTLEVIEADHLTREFGTIMRQVVMFKHERLLMLLERTQASHEDRARVFAIVGPVIGEEVLKAADRLKRDVIILQEAAHKIGENMGDCDCSSCERRRKDVEQRRTEEAANQKGSVH